MNPKVEWYFEKDTPWKQEVNELRQIVLDCKLTEHLKWGCPCYTLEDNNIVLIHIFKNYCALLFMKGALIPDPDTILIQQTEHVQSARQIRFTSLKQIIDMKKTIKTYIENAIEVEKSGLEVEYKKTDDFEIPIEFQHRLEENHGLRKAFYALTPGRQRAYLLHFANAKQSKTREQRIDKSIGLIMDGIGLNDEYTHSKKIKNKSQT
ncbi:MAG: DUF1801 domain-containing protein [bacterium]